MLTECLAANFFFQIATTEKSPLIDCNIQDSYHTALETKWGPKFKKEKRKCVLRVRNCMLLEAHETCSQKSADTLRVALVALRCQRCHVSRSV